MKATATLTVVLLFCLLTHLFAGPNEEAPSSNPSSETPSISTMTPEMWFYLQELRRHDDPQLAVRRKAEFRAEQRRQRLAVRKWYGYSQSRPQVSASPWTSSPRPLLWSKYQHTNRWRGNYPPYVAIESRSGSIWR